MVNRFLSVFSLGFSLCAALGASVAFAFDPPPSQIAARAWVLLDVQSGQLLTGYQHDERFEPASLTKLMTAYLVFDALKQKKLKPEQVVPVSDHARKATGSRMFIRWTSPSR